MDSLEGLDEGGMGSVVYLADGEATGGPGGLGGAGEDDVGVWGGGRGGEVAEDGEAEAGHGACEGDDGHFRWFRVVFLLIWIWSCGLTVRREWWTWCEVDRFRLVVI